MKIVTKLTSRLLLSAGLLLSVSCIRDEMPANRNDRSQEVVVELRLKTSDGSFRSTRSEASESEKKIENALVLFFKGTEPAAKLYAVSEGQALAPGTGNAISFKASFAVAAADADSPFACVVLANMLERTLAGELIAGQGNKVTLDALRAGINKMDYAALQKALVEPVTGPLQTNSAIFPMSGKAKETLIPSQSAAKRLTVSLLRDVARVNIMNTASADFTLTEAYVYRANQKRALLYEADALPSEATVVTKPSVPEGTTSFPIEGSATTWKYEVTGNNLIQKVYIPEADTHLAQSGETAAPGDKNHQNRCAIVVGGTYKGSKSYYRIDFTRTKSGNTRELSDVLRNHSYNITITAVRSGGESTPDDAYKAKSADLDASIIPWEDENQDIVFDGSNWASVNRKRIEFADGKDLEALLNVLSNMKPSQWKMAIGDNPAEGDIKSDATISGTYFKVTKPNDKSDTESQQGGNIVVRTLKAYPNNNQGDLPDREEKLHIYIGRLEVIVTLIQNAYSDIPWEDGGKFDGEF